MRFSKAGKDFFRSSNWILWIGMALFLKTMFFVYKVGIETDRLPNVFYKGTFSQEGGDTYSYIEPVDNLIAFGKYTAPVCEDFRMPGYGVVYFLNRQFLPVTDSLNLLSILQLILSSISVYILALTALTLFKTQFSFLLCFFLYGISTYVSLFDPMLLSESFSTAALIFSFYFLLKSDLKVKGLIISGLFLTWAIFLKPVFAPLLMLYIIYIFFMGNELKYVSAFLLPFVLADGTWMIRNFSLYHRIIPLTKTVYYPGVEGSYTGSLYHFMASFGGSIMWWKPGADISFFIPTPDYIARKETVELPSYIYTDKFNLDSLNEVKGLIKTASDTSLAENIRRTSEVMAMTKLESYTKSIKESKPLLFYITSRLRCFKTFYFHSGTYNLFTRMSSSLSATKLIIKVFYSLFYLCIVIAGFAGAIIILFKPERNKQLLLLSLTSLYLALIFPLGFKLDEFRYFVSAYPLFILLAVYLLNNFYSKVKKPNYA